MLQCLLDGLLAGTGYAALGLAFLLVLEGTGVLGVGLGAVYVLAPYIAGDVLAIGAPAPLAWLCALLAGVLAAALQEELIHRPLSRKRASSGVQFIGSLGAFMVLGHVVAMIWGPDPRSLQEVLPQTLHFAGLRTTTPQLIGAGINAVALLTLSGLLDRTATGLELKALADNQVLYCSTGRNLRRARRTIFAVAGALVALVSVSNATDLGFDPKVGISAVLISFAVAILAGTASPSGAIVAGIGIGAFRAVIAWLAGTEWQDAATFGLVAILMLPMPEGLQRLSFGARRLEELR